MARTITLKGIGSVSAKPDLIVVSMTIKNKNMDYQKSIEACAEQIQKITNAVVNAGLNESDLKTTSFKVDTKYVNKKDYNGDYKRVFDGYECEQRLKLAFDIDIPLLGKVMSGIASCLAKPELSIKFTVKNPNAISEQLLESASKNAKSKAQVLCNSLDVKLGDLLTIDYNWGEIDIYSNTRYEVEYACMADSMPKSTIDKMNFTPDDIDLTDTVTFVWEIV